MRKLLSILLAITLMQASALADSMTVWVLCQPDSYVNIRDTPNRHGRKEGYAMCGDSFETDGKERNGFIHVYASIEAGEGWISNGYIVWDAPEAVNATGWVCSKGRVAVRRSIGGDRRKWCHDGDELQVYWMSGEWAITDAGFLKTEYLEVFQ